MTLYGESDVTFRPQPNKSTLLLFSTSVLILMMQLAVLAGSLSWFLSVSGWSPGDPFPVYAPFAERFQLPGVDGAAKLAREALAPLALLVIGTIALYFWPTAQTLGSRSASQLTTIAFAVVAMTLAMDDSIWQWLNGDLREFWKPVTIIGALFLVFQAEAQAITLLNNVFPLETPASRLKLWLLRIPLALIIVATLGLTAGHLPLALAAAAALIVTLLAQLGRRPAASWEKLTDVHLREASAIALVALVVVLVASVALFGNAAAGLPRRAVVFSAPGVKIVPAESFRLTAPGSPAATTSGTTEGGEKKKDESVIDIRWSDKKKEK